MARKKLKTFVGTRVTQEGKRVADDKIPLYIETHGDCRLCMELPDYIPALLGTDVRLSDGCKMEPADGKPYRRSGPVWLFGPTPKALEEAWHRVGSLYMEQLTLVKVVPKIFVHVVVEGGDYRDKRNYSLNIARFLRDEKAQQNYAWRETDTAKLERVHGYHTGGVRIGHSMSGPEAAVLPYDEVLWQRLVALRDSIHEGFEKLRELSLADEFVPRLLAGSVLQLTGPEKQA
jgi:hypothetical protein